ncbi:MAG TPA: methyltransferase domain-containing protein [Acetobacteraceae bacterium]|nr:methyltransferase domain-containing protein [Acetobacteraceae bacterium]
MSDPPATQAIDWESRYRDGATGWERPGLNPSFVTWRETGVLTPCRILVPGAGRSPEPLALAEAGFDVTLVDLSPTAIATQRARLERLHVKAHVAQADILQWTPPALFDAVYDQACLCALPPAIWPDYAERLHRWLLPDGALYILFMQSTRAGGPPFHCDLDVMRDLFPASAWTWPETLAPLVDHSPGLAEQSAVLRSR